MTTALLEAKATPVASGGPRPRGARAPIEHIAIIISKGTLDMTYPGLILANAARMSGIEATLFFTFWGLDAITEKRVDDLHVSTVGNPSLHIPTLVGGLPGMEELATTFMKREMEKIEIPPVREMLQILHDSGAKIYACRMAMEMFHRTRSDLVSEVDDIISAMDFFDKAAGAQVLFI